jgi:hypothetical protein
MQQSTTSAAEHHNHAAKHHQEAAKHHEAGNHEKAAHHAHIAHGHHLHAERHANEAAKLTLSTMRQCWLTSVRDHPAPIRRKLHQDQIFYVGRHRLHFFDTNGVIRALTAVSVHHGFDVAAEWLSRRSGPANALRSFRYCWITGLTESPAGTGKPALLRENKRSGGG